VGLSASGLWRVIVKAKEGMYLILTGVLSSAMCKTKSTTAFSSNGVRYC
jgi:hypothetical protein